MKGKLGSNVPMQPTIPKMPSNTSNALDALADAYKGRSNALKNQTKWNRMMLYLADLQLTYSPDWGANGQGDQKLYDFVTELIDEFSGWDVTDTNVGNTISRQAAIDAVQNRPMMLSKEKVLLINELEKLPSAEPKRGKCKWCERLKERNLRIEYYWIDQEGCTASFSEPHVVATGIANFCPNCGRKMEREVSDE